MMPLNNGRIHIARNGSILGVYDVEKLGDLLETGQLLPTDQFYDNNAAEWIPLSSWKPAHPAGEFKPAEEKPSEERSSRSGGKRGRRPHSKKRKEKTALGGWIACLFALGAAAGLWAWGNITREELASANEKIQALNLVVENLKKENQLLSEVTPPGRVRAIITYEPNANQVAIMSGATVGLYRRSDVEKAIVKSQETGGPLFSAEESFDQAIERLKAAIPSPIQITLTDSNGRVDTAVPEPGDYVLVASAAKAIAGGGNERYFWMTGFRASDQPSGLILLNEKNAISARKPAFVITNPSGMAPAAAP